jgi:hypothetical protein
MKDKKMEIEKSHSQKNLISGAQKNEKPEDFVLGREVYGMD